MIQGATRCHGLLAEAAGADHLLKKDGFWEAYRDGRRLSAAIRQAQRRSEVYGTNHRCLDAAQLSEEEPALKPGLAGAIHWSDTWRCVDPGGLVEAYAQLFLRRGGAIIGGDATSLVQTKTGWRIAGMDAERVVVALGPWSPGLLSRFGYRVPMIPKRGYHVHFKGDHGLRRSMLLADDSVVLAPMLKGLRIATAAELTMSAPARAPRQLTRGEAAARSLLKFRGPVEDVAWEGTRPCLPGMLPLVREAPRHRGLWMNFGHGHQGFTLGPVTAQRIASAMEGDVSTIEGLDRGLV
jgi:D-amino-acid dehydrogenase